MTNGNSIDFSINRDLAEKFGMALKLNNESSKDVITRLMNQYVAETFSKVSEAATIQSSGRAVGSSTPHIVTKKKENSKITDEMVAISYKFAKKVYFGKMTRTEGKIAVSRASGMNEGSAQDYITDFLAMMEGNEYRRAMCNYGTSYFLENIRRDFGDSAFEKAIEATEKHIKYYNGLGRGQMKEKERIVTRFKEML